MHSTMGVKPLCPRTDFPLNHLTKPEGNSGLRHFLLIPASRNEEKSATWSEPSPLQVNPDGSYHTQCRLIRVVVYEIM